ncbi:BON domain-containing protein [Horticoccus luteus]|uniref:BON domain-containing protein n=1 Tax=Horticoccus luteus TaxID=2862869 RepID=A0A8F9XFG0_9BACT|nr:BON domain-containing protein [Horticoccus luteus]QYM78052.1 BON domain-containing protein [Horticoccus luteus]
MGKLFFFLIGLVVGGYAVHVYERSESAPGRSSPGTGASLGDKTRETAGRAASESRDAAANARDTLSEKLHDWHLTGDDIKADLAKTGEIVRSKAAVVGERMTDARIVTVIKAKYMLDRELSAFDINIDCRDGHVSLRGSVASPDLAGKAVALALDTDGVTNVKADLSPRAK